MSRIGSDVRETRNQSTETRMQKRKNVIRSLVTGYWLLNKAFTLVEVMVTTAVLSLGAVLIYEAFFTSLNAFDYCSDYLNIAPWVDEKIWQVEDYLRCFGSSDKIATTGILTSKSKRFDWVLSCNLIDGNSVQDLYKINLVLFWQQGERKKELARTTYALYEKKEE